MVSKASFTEKSVSKEEKSFNKKLECTKIAQTIDYFFGALENLYPGTPLADDIAGTRDSISNITMKQSPLKTLTYSIIPLKCTY